MSAGHEKLIETAEGWELPVREYRVALLTIDFSLCLELVGEGDEDQRCRVSIAGPFTYTAADGRLSVLDADCARSQLGPALDCFGKQVEQLGVRKRDGGLELRFSDGSRLEVAPQDHFEAWNLTGPKSLMFVCTPGGGEPAFWN